MPEKTDVPSNFTLKLRKHIRTRRIEAIQQLGADRIVQITIGSGDATYYLILEFYAQGNVILTDKSYQVLTLLRSHRDDAKGMATMARHTYPIHSVRLREPLAFEKFVAALDTAANAGGDRKSGGSVASIEAYNKEQEEEEEEVVIEDSKVTAATTTTLKSVLAELVPYGPSVAEHCIRTAGLDPSRSLSPQASGGGSLTDAEKEALMASIRRFEKWLDGCEDAATPAPGGAILTTAAGDEKGTGTGTSSAGISGEHQDFSLSSTAVYNDFEPLVEDNFPFEQHKSHPGLIKFQTFDAAVSEYYGKLHGQRAIAQQAQREKQAVGKLDAIRRDHELRLEALAAEKEAAERRAALIELNLDAVDAALNAVREALAGGMDWNDLRRMIKEEKKAGNPVAALIDSLLLEKNKIILVLRDPLKDDDSDEEKEEAEDEVEVVHQKSNKNKNKMNKKNKFNGQRKQKKHVDLRVEVDLDLTAHANARAHYDARKKHADKTRRTLEVSERALIAAEKKAQEALAKVRRTASAKTGAAAAAASARKPYWFERFHWFISSENYLVLSGRDAQQNELLVKRYLRKGDAYVHADVHGAASTVIKNNDSTMPIPPLTLSQAGQACVCRSAAWDAKVITSAYWVHPHQVSKTAPSGEYLTTGSFMIRGRKNYLPPQQLVMGIAWLFRLEEESIKGHLGERAVRVDLLTENGAAARGGRESLGEEDMEEATVEKREEQGTVVSESRSALDAFMDSSVDTLQQQQQKQKQQPSLGGGAGGNSQMEATFDRYGLGNALPTTSDQVEYVEVDEDSGKDVLDMLGVNRGGGGSGNGGSASSTRRHLSAKERQLLKKGVTLEDIPAVLEKKKSSSQTQPSEAATIEQPPPQQQQQQQGVRGLKGKAAKKNKKYAEQDDEERELAMSLLQSAGQKKDRKQRKDERKAKMAARKAAKTGLTKIEVTEEDIAKLTARLDLEPEDEENDDEQEEDEEDDAAEKSERASAAGSGGDEEQEQYSKEEIEDSEDINNNAKDDELQRERAEVAEILASEGVAMLDDADRERLTQLDELTGIPRPEDVILYAVPVCAPYHVVSHYKYKVKLVPGTLKKGKAFKQSVELLTGWNAVATSGGRNGAASNGIEGSTSLSAADVAAANARELELIRAVVEMDGINAMVGGVKLQVAGLQKMQMAKKKAAGKGKKK
jgi:predicted ribosome quality control (RQC) complex YloA/Tae2 family protein